VLLPGVTNGRLAPSSTVFTVVSPIRSSPSAPTWTLASSRSGPSGMARVSFSSPRSSKSWIVRLPTVSGAVVPLSV